jgi:hypothetical protein
MEKCDRCGLSEAAHKGFLEPASVPVTRPFRLWLVAVLVGELARMRVFVLFQASSPILWTLISG